MARTLTQRAVHACEHVLTGLPPGASLDVPELVRSSGIPARVPLVTRRLREGHWIAPDGHGGWLYAGRPSPRPAPPSARG